LRKGRAPGQVVPLWIEVAIEMIALLFSTLNIGSTKPFLQTSNKDYGCEWDYDFRNKRFLAEDNTKFGVNIVMYAMGS
jgi:hypothetical protein